VLFSLGFNLLEQLILCLVLSKGLLYSVTSFWTDVDLRVLRKMRPPSYATSSGSAGFDFNYKPDSRYYCSITAGRGRFRMQE
jgi:hypothetical protein